IFGYLRLIHLAVKLPQYVTLKCQRNTFVEICAFTVFEHLQTVIPPDKCTFSRFYNRLFIPVNNYLLARIDINQNVFGLGVYAVCAIFRKARKENARIA